jgi:D-beta-D-heptose 7-phosphate kinase/D-beta-D-heptose 1-phosphate adenosyltransferase
MLTYEQIQKKIVSPDKLEKLFSASFREKHRIVFTNGCFDLLHRGHIYYLSRARELGDILVIGLNSDDSVTRLKGPGRPLNNQQARAEVLGGLAFVDYLVYFHEDTPLELIRQVRPHLLIKGGDYQMEEIVGYRDMLTWGGKTKTIPLLEGYSTTSIIERKS